MSTVPHSPFIARSAQSVFTARIAVLVDTDGRVLDAQVEAPSGRELENRLLDRALMDALRRFHFEPARGASGPQHGWSTVEYALRLEPGAAS